MKTQPTKKLGLILGIIAIFLLILTSQSLLRNNNRGLISNKSTPTIIPTKNCSQLSLEECVKSLDCDPEYTSPSCPACLNIGTYKDCKQSSDKKTKKAICDKTGGYWNYNEVHHCQCPENIGKYNRGGYGNLGCLTNEELCTQTNGTYKENCLCPAGFHWEWNFGCYKSD